MAIFVLFCAIAGYAQDEDGGAPGFNYEYFEPALVPDSDLEVGINPTSVNISPSGLIGVVANADSDSVTVFSALAGNIVGEIKLPEGSRPVSAVINDTLNAPNEDSQMGYVLVSLQRTNQIAVVPFSRNDLNNNTWEVKKLTELRDYSVEMAGEIVNFLYDFPGASYLMMDKATGKVYGIYPGVTDFFETLGQPGFPSSNVSSVYYPETGELISFFMGKDGGRIAALSEFVKDGPCAGKGQDKSKGKGKGECKGIGVAKGFQKTKLEDVQIQYFDWNNYPGALAVNPVENRVYMAIAQLHEVKVFDAATMEPILSFPAGEFPTDIAIEPTTGLLFVSDFEGKKVLMLDGKTGELISEAYTETEPKTVTALPMGGAIYSSFPYGDLVQRMSTYQLKTEEETGVSEQ